MNVRKNYKDESGKKDIQKGLIKAEGESTNAGIIE
jgi:hypothetical protein